MISCKGRTLAFSFWCLEFSKDSSGGSHLFLSRDFLQLFFAINHINIVSPPPPPQLSMRSAGGGTWVQNLQPPLWKETFPLEQWNTGKPQVAVEIHISKFALRIWLRHCAIQTGIYALCPDPLNFSSFQNKKSPLRSNFHFCLMMT